MAVLVAAIMIVAMAVPAWATTYDDSGKGDLAIAVAGSGTADKGTITINNAEDGETYTAYRILDLFSFDDNDARTSQHDATKEHYAYAIAASGTNASPWYKFVTDNGTLATVADAPASGKYFYIDNKNPFVVNGTTYYFVSGANSFDFAAASHYDDEADRASAISGNTYNNVQAVARAAKLYTTTADYTGNTNKANYESAAQAVTGQSGTTTDDAVSEKVTIQWTELPLGYYLVDSSVGSMVALDTTNKDVNMLDKNLSPTLTKVVKLREYNTQVRGADNSYGANEATWFGSNTNLEIGQKATFLCKITVPKGATQYVLHDVMEKGLKLYDSSATDTPSYNIKVYARTAADESGTAYKVSEIPALKEAGKPNWKLDVGTTGTYSKKLSNGCDFEITFYPLLLESLPTNSWIEVEYQAEVTKDAFVWGYTGSGTALEEEEDASGAYTTITPNTSDTDIESGPAEPGSLEDVKQIPTNMNGDEKNTNSAILTYGNKSATRWATATVETYKFDFVKTKENDNSTNANTYDLLGGATFKLYRSTLETDADNTDWFDSYKDASTPTLNDSDAVLFKVTAGNWTAGTNVDEYRVADSTDTSTTDVITTYNYKKVTFSGLKAGTYFLKEISAPDGFHILPGYFKLVVTAADGADNGKVTYSYYNTNYSSGTTPAIAEATIAKWDATITAGTEATNTPAYYAGASAGGLQITNKTSTELPSTGGMGTTVLYIVGGMLVILAGAYLFFSRKRTA